MADGFNGRKSVNKEDKAYLSYDRQEWVVKQFFKAECMFLKGLKTKALCFQRVQILFGWVNQIEWVTFCDASSPLWPLLPRDYQATHASDNGF